MKFYCDNCQTKYSIADEKVRGKVLKVRCKKCSHVITVREPETPVSATSRGAQRGGGGPQRPSAPGPPAAPTWHYSINGQSFGPYPKRELDERFASGELGDAAYVWNETFTDWKRVTEVPAFSAALKKAARVRPSPKTHGVSQALKAIDSATYDESRDKRDEKEASAGQVSKPAGDSRRGAGEKKERKLSPLQRMEREGAAKSPLEREQEDLTEMDLELPAAVQKLRSRNLSPDRGTGQKDRLDRLRQRLSIGPADDAGEVERKSDESSTAHPAEPSEQQPLVPEGADSTSSVGEPDGVDAGGEWESEISDDLDVAHADTLTPEELFDGQDSQDSSGPEAEDSSLLATQGSVHDGLFGGPSDAVESVESHPEPDEEEQAAAEDEDEDAVPFFPEAPTLEKFKVDQSTSISRVDEMTDSLLIQLDELKSDGRKQFIVGAIGAALALLVVGTVGYFGFMAASSTESEGGSSQPRIIEDHFGAAPDFSSYTREELAAVSEEHILEEQDLSEIEVEEAQEESDSGGEPSSGGGSSSGTQREESPTASGSPTDIEVDIDGVLDGSGSDVPAGAPGSRTEGGGALARPGDTEAGRMDFDSAGGEGFGTGLGVDDDSQLEVHQVDEDLGLERRQVQEGLTAQDRFSAQGQIASRVVHCRQRHYNRGEGDLPASSIQVQFYVLPDGDIVEFEITPASMNDTLFAECLRRDTRHWNYFPRFTGNPERIVIPMSLE